MQLKSKCKKRITKLDEGLAKVEYILFQENGAPFVLPQFTRRLAAGSIARHRERAQLRKERLLSPSPIDLAEVNDELATLDAVEVALATTPPEKPIGP